MYRKRRNARLDGHYFGVCPECGMCGDRLNEAHWHWMVCHTHRLKWCIGSNLLPDWREESGVGLHLSATLLPRYQEVEPAWPVLEQAPRPQPMWGAQARKPAGAYTLTG